MSSEIAIKVDNLSKCYQIYDNPRDRLMQMLMRGRRQYYREFWALRDVSFEVKAGETLGIIGRNGSGKSTLLQMICGTLNPTSGSIQTQGRIAALLELGSGFNPEFTGRENVYMNAAVMGLSKEEIESRFDKIEEFADIGEYIDQPTRMYSSGMYVRLAFSVAVNVSPDILIVDEALAVGDIRFQVKCHRVFEEFRDSGKTMILVSHSSSDVVRLCENAIWLDEGKKRKEGNSKALVEAYLAEMVHNVGVKPIVDADRLEVGPMAVANSLVALPSNATATGEGGVSVLAIGLFDENKNRLVTIDGARRVQIEFLAKTIVTLDVPFFAFQVINSRGLRVLGSNTLVQRKIVESIGPGQTVQISFTFDFPELENGEYLIAVGVGDGTATNHIRHVFVADAYIFQVVSCSSYQEQAVLLKLPSCTSNVKIV